MKNILIHGLGQTEYSWNQTNTYLKEKGINTVCPNLFDLIKNSSKEYMVLYQKFVDFCNEQNGKLNLCGLSLGGVLALDFVKRYPEKVNSIVLIGTPYKIPKMLFRLQCMIFYIMPKSIFEKMGISKRDFITLVHSMKDLKIETDLDKIRCKTLILCGEKDHVNKGSAKLLNKSMENSKMQIVNNSSHEVNIDNPETLANLIHAFWLENK